METTPYSKLYSKFLDDTEIACRIYEMLANDILGKKQLDRIRSYDTMICAVIFSSIPKTRLKN